MKTTLELNGFIYGQHDNSNYLHQEDTYIMAENYFQKLYDIDVTDKKKNKNGLNYLSWAACWAEVKKMFPDAAFTIYEQTISITENIENTEIRKLIERPWFDDGKTGWVKTGVTINGIEHIEELPILDFKNKSLAASAITSQEANKAIQRSLTKACARHGLGLYIYEGEDLPELTKELEKLRADCWKLFCDRAKISDNAKDKANELCKAADASGDPRQITDTEILANLKKDLMAIRK
jgi:hypothetical protein